MPYRVTGFQLIFLDGTSRVAVLYVQNYRTIGYSFLRIEEETKTNLILASLPSHIDANLRSHRY